LQTIAIVGEASGGRVHIVYPWPLLPSAKLRGCRPKILLSFEVIEITMMLKIYLAIEVKVESLF
jgi:hypothetical protein